MIDLASLMGDVLDGLDRPETSVFPTKVGNQEGGGNEQVTDNNAFPTVPTIPTAKQVPLQAETVVSHCDHNAQVRACSEFMYFGGKSGNGGKCQQEQGVLLPTIDFQGGNRWEKPDAAGGAQAGPRLSAGAARSGWADLDQHPAERSAPAEVEAWRRRFYILSSVEPPCPGFRLSMDWRETYDAVHAFLEEHAETAHSLGWTTLDLFAVHRTVGGIRVDCVGAALLAAGNRVSAVEANVIHFNRLWDGQPCGRFFRVPHNPEMVAVWNFSPASDRFK